MISQGVKVAKQGFGSRILKWIVVGILLLIIISLVWVLWSMYANYGLNPLDPSTWDDSLLALMEAKAGVSDTGQSAGSSWLSASLRFSPFGFLGGAIGIGTSATGRAGMAENWTKGKNSAYTFYKRLSGN
jgi:hypothetical protein